LSGVTAAQCVVCYLLWCLAHGISWLVAKEAPERCGGAPELPCGFLAKAYDGERHGVTLGSRASKLHLAPIRRGGAVLPRCDETLMDEVRCGSPVAFGAIGGFALGSAEMVDLSQPDALR